MPPDAADHFTDASKMVPRRIQRSRAKGWRMPREWDALEREEFEEERRARLRGGDRCQCGDDLPGRCPGPHVCPANRAEPGDEDAEGEE